MISATARAFMVRDGRIVEQLRPIEVTGRILDDLRRAAADALRAGHPGMSISVHVEATPPGEPVRLVAYLRDDPYAARRPDAHRRASARRLPLA